MNQKPSVSPALQFAILLGLLGIFIIISALIIPVLGAYLLHVPPLQVIPAMNLAENANISRFLNTLASFFAFMMPPLILARIISKRPFRQLGFHTGVNMKQVFWIITIALASMVLGGALGELNERIPLPADLYNKAKQLEETYKAAMMAMAKMQSFNEFLVVLAVLAVFPAFFEEILFRGGFQQVFVSWTGKKWAGIIITSIIFSIFHFSYFGFLPRVMLGIILGLVFHESRNLWLAILLHFVNNAVIVVQLYVASRAGKSIEKTMDESMPMWWGLIAVVIVLVLLSFFKQESKRVLAKRKAALFGSPENMQS
jgi:membrane protease YdiL (CAAX protease family)